MTRALALALAVVCAAGCATEYVVDDHDPFDFDVPPPDGKADGVPAVFDANNVLSDDLLRAGDAMDADAVQAFFEHTPYNNRSWLATARVNGVLVSQLVVEAAQADNIHPLVLIARMQVEAGLVSKTVAPSQRLIDKALGCGCADGSACTSSDRGLGRQLTCGARVMHAMFDASVDGTGEWRRGHPARTADPRTVTPATHATAAMYAYTPWVLQGTGGNWLAWNITRKYVTFAENAGLVH